MKKIILLISMTFSLMAQESPLHEEIEKRLEFIENSYFPHLDHKERREAIQAIDEIIELVNRMEAIEEDNTPFLKSKSFAVLKKRVENEKSDRMRTYRVQKVLQDQWLSSDQVKALLPYFTTDKAKEAFIRSIYNRIYDKINFIEILYSFTTEETKESLTEHMLKNTHSTEWDNNPLYNSLSEDNFILVTNTLETLPFDKDKIKIIVLLAQSGYFTAIQLEDMLSTLDFDSNKATCLQAVYKSVSDQENLIMALRSIDNNFRRRDLEKQLLGE